MSGLVRHALRSQLRRPPTTRLPRVVSWSLSGRQWLARQKARNECERPRRVVSYYVVVRARCSVSVKSRACRARIQEASTSPLRLIRCSGVPCGRVPGRRGRERRRAIGPKGRVSTPRVRVRYTEPRDRSWAGLRCLTGPLKTLIRFNRISGGKGLTPSLRCYHGW